MPDALPAPVHVAVIDSGVHPAHPHIAAGQLEPGVSVARDGSLAWGQEATADCLGHGTAVTAAIQQWAPAAMIVPVRVFSSELRTSPRALVAAIDWAADAGVDLINLSLGTPVKAHGPVIEAAVRRAMAAGAVLIAARAVDGAPCFPGALPETLGVGLDWDCPREGWRLAAGADGEAYVTASGYPRPIPGFPQRRNLHGISFAVANVTGFAAAMLGKGGAPMSGPERLRWLREGFSAGVEAVA